LIQDLLVWVQELGPWGIFTFLILCSFGLPLAKSLLLLLAGMLAHQDSSQALPFFLACVLGLHGGDFALFLIGWFLDESLFQLPVIRKIFPPKTVLKTKALIEEHGLFSLVIVRLTPYIRGACYLMFGSLRMNIIKFNAINIMVAAVYTFFFFVPGYLLVTQLENLKAISKYGNTLLTALLILLLTGIFLRWRWKKRKPK